MIKMSVEVLGETQMLSRLSRLQENMDNVVPALKEMDEDVRKGMLERRFQSQGPGWAPLSARYAAYKARVYPGKPILQATGAMRNSLVGTPGMILGGQALIIGMSAPDYAYFHQRGAPSINLPKREISKSTPEDRKRWAKILQRHLFQGMGDR